MKYGSADDLSSELTYHRYMFNQVQVTGLFKEVSVPEYIALHLISGSISQKGNGAENCLCGISLHCFTDSSYTFRRPL